MSVLHFRPSSRLISRHAGRSRESLYPDRLGLDTHVIMSAFAWLDLAAALHLAGGLAFGSAVAAIFGALGGAVVSLIAAAKAMETN